MNEYVMSLLFITIWREARGEGMDGMRACACVARNRVKAWNQSWHRVLCGKNQFSSMSVRGDAQLIIWPDPEDDLAAVEALAMCGNVVLGYENDTTNGALYYANLKTATSGWFFEKIVNDPVNHPTTLVLGNHTFFK